MGEIRDFKSEGSGRMPPSSATSRRLAAIIVGDVASYSRLMQLDEEGTLAASGGSSAISLNRASPNITASWSRPQGMASSRLSTVPSRLSGAVLSSSRTCLAAMRLSQDSPGSNTGSASTSAT